MEGPGTDIFVGDVSCDPGGEDCDVVDRVEEELDDDLDEIVLEVLG